MRMNGGAILNAVAPATVAGYLAFTVVTKGDSLLLFFYAVLGQIVVLALGMCKEREWWPFAGKAAVWPFRIVVFWSFDCIARSFNQHNQALWIYIAFFTLIACVTIVALRRRWYQSGA